MPLFTPCSYMDERLEKQKEKKEEEEKVQERKEEKAERALQTGWQMQIQVRGLVKISYILFKSRRKVFCI